MEDRTTSSRRTVALIVASGLLGAAVTVGGLAILVGSSRDDAHARRIETVIVAREAARQAAVEARLEAAAARAEAERRSSTGRRIRIRGSSRDAVAPIVYVDGVRVQMEGSALSSADGQVSRVLGFVDGAQVRIEGSAVSGTDGQVSRVLGIDQLDPDNIDRVEVLKGPKAVELYGSEGENGVIQIFTKSGSGSR